MNIAFLLPFGAFLINGFVWIYIYAQKKIDLVSKSFLIYAAVLEFWIVSVILCRLPIPEHYILSVLNAGSAAWLLIAFLFLNFVYRFINKKHDTAYFGMLALSLLFILISLFTDFIIADYRHFTWGYVETPGNLYLTATIGAIIIPGSYSIYLIYNYKKKLSEGRYKKTLNLILYGTIFLLIFGYTTDVFLPFVIKMPFIFQMAESATAIQSLLIFFAVRKYKLFASRLEDVSFTLFENLLNAILITDKSGVILEANLKAKKLFRIKDSGGRNLIIKDYIPGYSEELQHFEFKLGNAGSEKYLYLTQNAVKSDESGASRIILIKDITEEKVNRQKFLESQNMFQGLFESAPDGLIVIDHYGKITKVNQQAEKMFGYTMEELINSTIEKLIPDRFSEVHIQHRRKYLAEPRKREMGEGLDLYALRKDGTEFPVDIMLSYIEIKSGMLVLATIRDITERKKTEDYIRKQQMMLAQAEEITHLGSWEWNIAEDKVTWSDELYNIFGLTTRPDLSFDFYISRIHPADRDRVKSIILAAVEKKQNFELYERIVKPDGEVRIIFSKGILHYDGNGNPANMVGSCLDVTDFKKTEYELRSSKDQLRALAANLHNAREEERLYIAREIHDRLGQGLTAMKMDVFHINKLMSNHTSEKEFTNELNKIINIIDNQIETVRNISKELRPEVLDHFGLVSAIEWQLNEFQNKSGIEAAFNSFTENIDMDSNKSIAVYRIIQEALTNIIRHAEATKVNVSIKQENSEITIEVADNGKGISEEEISDIKSIGIIGMKERALIFGGKVKIYGCKGEGTKVTIRIP